jgi:hypothetical protein
VRKIWLGAALAASGVVLAFAGGAQSAQLVTLDAGFQPDKLGAPTTVKFGFKVSNSSPKTVPSPVVGVDLYLPAGMGIATSTLGLAVCQPPRLLLLGLKGCPANARVGFGRASGKLRVDGEVVEEAATVQSVLGPNENHHEQVLFYVETQAPVSSELIFSGELLPSSTSVFSSHLDTSIPIVPAWNGGPDIAVTSFSSTLGPLGLTYFRHVRGVSVPFHPKGIGVPVRCPQGGFPFAAQLVFMDGSRVDARAAVPCPS